MLATKDRPAELMAKTFFALLPLADLSAKKTTKKTKKEPEKEIVSEVNPIDLNSQATLVTPPGLHYNIQIHFPATKDIEVYNAIFKSLREHLIG